MFPYPVNLLSDSCIEFVKYVALPLLLLLPVCYLINVFIHAASAPGVFESSSAESIFSLQALFAFIAAFPVAAVSVPHTFDFEGVALDALAGLLFFMVLLLFPSIGYCGLPFSKRESVSLDQQFVCRRTLMHTLNVMA